MPWPAKQRTAIFLRIKREKGEAAARRFMHEHGYTGKAKAKRRKKKVNPAAARHGARRAS